MKNFFVLVSVAEILASKRHLCLSLYLCLYICMSVPPGVGRWGPWERWGPRGRFAGVESVQRRREGPGLRKGSVGWRVVGDGGQGVFPWLARGPTKAGLAACNKYIYIVLSAAVQCFNSIHPLGFPIC